MRPAPLPTNGVHAAEHELADRIARNVKSRREWKHMEVRELAARADVSEGTVRNAEAGNPISTRTLARIAHALGCLPGRLV